MSTASVEEDAMRRESWLRTLGVTVCVAAVAAPVALAAQERPNPFAQPSNLPFQAPRFDIIRDSDYEPAFAQGMAEQAAEIARIADNPAAPTFDNTLVAMERSGRMLQRVQAAFGAVAQADTNPARQAIQRAIGPKLAAHADAIYLNPKLFARVRALYEHRATLRLDPEQRQLLQLVYQRFVRAGRSSRWRTRRNCARSTASSPPSRPPSSRNCSPGPRRAGWWPTIRPSWRASVIPASPQPLKRRRRGASPARG
jgi:hypothetical protein